jgi:excisionase family DNA binding protein
VGPAIEIETDAQDEYLTVPEVAQLYRLHPSTVTDLCRSGLIGAVRVGNGRGRWRIPAARMKAYSASRTPQPTAA